MPVHPFMSLLFSFLMNKVKLKSGGGTLFKKAYLGPNNVRIICSSKNLNQQADCFAGRWLSNIRQFCARLVDQQIIDISAIIQAIVFSG